MFFTSIDALKRKPKAIRQQYAFVGALLITGVISGVWTLTLPARFSPTVELADTQAATGPFAGMWQSFRDRWQTMQDSVAALPIAAVATSTSSSTTDIDMSVVTHPTTTIPKPTTPDPAPVMILIATTTDAVGE